MSHVLQQDCVHGRDPFGVGMGSRAEASVSEDLAEIGGLWNLTMGGEFSFYIVIGL